MLETLLLAAPIFLLILIGYVGAWTKLLPENMGDSLADYVFIIATPMLMFKMVVFSTPVGDAPLGYLISYYIGMVFGWISVMAMTYWVLKNTWGESVIAGLSTGQANTVMIGIPLILNAYGEAGVAPITLLMAVNLPVTMTIATLLLEGGRARGNVAWLLIKGLCTHPILIGLFAAFAYKYLNLPVPMLAKTVIEMLALTAIPISLLALGMALKRYWVWGHMKTLMTISVVKLFLHPLITYILATSYFQLSPVWVGSAVIFSSMPAGINAYLFARRYGEGEGLASSAVALTTFISVVTTVLWLSILPKP